MSCQYLMTFTPVDTFTFSGETSVQTKGSKVNQAFFSEDRYYGRRQSFLVNTEMMPPQTTVMGAVRHFLLMDRGATFKNGAGIIGSGSFNPAAPSEEMGEIESISCVCVTGKDGNQRMLCIPAPNDNAYGAADKNLYQPMGIDEYNPKEFYRHGFLQYKLFQENDVWTCSTEAYRWAGQDAFFAVSTRAAFAIPEMGKPERDEGNFHMQQRCQLRDVRLNHEKAVLAEPAFCVVVALNKELDHASESRMMSLGGRGSMFAVKAEPCQIDINSVSVHTGVEKERNDFRLSLTSPARLPKGWHEAKGLKHAFVSTRPVRSAVTDADMKLKLIEQRLTFADTGSVFIFEHAESRETFRQMLSDSKLTVCGFNQTIKY